jgi:hypothetical protein
LCLAAICSPFLLAVFGDLYAATAIRFWPVALWLVKARIG